MKDKNLHPVVYAKKIFYNHLISFIKLFDVNLYEILVCLTGSHTNKGKIDGIIDICIIPSKNENEKNWILFQKELERKKEFLKWYNIKVWAFSLNKAFFETENGNFSNKVKIYDLSYLYRYIAVFDPAERLERWKEQLKKIPKSAISCLCENLYYRVRYTPKIKNAKKALQFYSDRIIKIEQGILPSPIMQIDKEITCVIKNKDKKIGSCENVEKLNIAKDIIKKWTLKLLPKVLNKKNQFVLDIILSQLSIAEYYLLDKVELDMSDNFLEKSEEIIKWGEQLNLKWKQCKKSTIPVWVLPTE